MNTYVFFLGGQDAEMQAIRDILAGEGIRFYDRNLRWDNAKLSAYQEDLQTLGPDDIPVFVELNPDIPYPENGIVIDHHGERAGHTQKTSLEQVADLLGRELDRRQQLISANDRGHIRAMQEMGATDAEVQDIRALDRRAQGVTEQDEALAEESVQKHLEKIPDDGAVIHSLTNRSSPVVDRVWGWFNHLFILTPDGGIHYSGRGETIERLKARYQEKQSKDPSVEYWYGGDLPVCGFFGANLALDIEAIKAVAEEKVLSHHLFLFPFTLEENKSSSPDTDTENPEDFMISAAEGLKAEGWEETPFEPETDNLKYSEYVYFHPFVRPAMFGGISRADANPVLRYFSLPVSDDDEFVIEVKTQDDETPGKYHQREYRLKVAGISLRLYETRIGVICFDLLNLEHPERDDVIRINDLGRRIYPQFLGEIHGVRDTKNVFLAHRICLRVNGKEYDENFSQNRFHKPYPVVGHHVDGLLGKSFVTDPSALGKNGARFLYTPTIDDRMYTVCWYGNGEWGEELKRQSFFEYAYLRDADWYRFVFLDGNDAGCAHPEMMRRLIQESTYERWADMGTLYGISRYSLVCLSDTGFGYHILRHHMRKQYAQMAALLLAQRASILSFSHRVTKISHNIQRLRSHPESGDSADADRIAEQVERLHAEYISFINRLWFIEISPQEQAIEMHTQAMEIMRLKQDMAELKAEIKDLYEYVGITQDRAANRKMNHLNILGALFLPLIVITGFFGMNLFFIYNSVLEQVFGFKWLIHFLFSLLLFVLFLIVSIAITWGIQSDMEKVKRLITHYMSLDFWSYALFRAFKITKSPFFKSRKNGSDDQNEKPESERPKRSSSKTKGERR